MHQVGVAEQRDPLARDDRVEHPVADRRGDAGARAVVVRRPPAHDLDPAGAVGSPELVGHLEAHAPLARVRMLRALLGERSSAGATVRVDVVHVHEPCPGGLRGGEHGALERREVLGPAMVLGVQGLVHGCRALRRTSGERGIRDVARHDLDRVQRLAVALERLSAPAVDDAHRQVATDERERGRAADRTRPEHDVHGPRHTRIPVADASAAGADTMAVVGRPAGWTMGLLHFVE